VALKVMLEGPFASDRARIRFEREALLIAGFKHPNIIVVHDSGSAEGRHFFVMDYVRGSHLGEYVREKNLPPREIIRLFTQVCDAVAYGHRRGVIHRDLKPSNILVNEGGTPFVLDFGLAKVTGEEMFQAGASVLSHSGHLLGTLAYMAPEQTRGDPHAIDVRTDVYALGVILYELLTGALPYDTESELATVLRNIQELDPPRLATRSTGTLRRGLTGELDAIIRKAMEKRPERRYQSASELKADLDAWLDGRPIVAKSQSSFYLIRKIAARHSFETSVLAALVVTIIASAFISYEYYQREQIAAGELRHANEVIRQDLRDLEQRLESTTTLAEASLREQALGWFLLEWHAGRLDRARQIQALTARSSPGYAAAMAFLLDENYPFAQLRSDLSGEANSEALTWFLQGERHAQAGRSAEASDAFGRSLEFCRAQPAGSWLQSAVEARLRQLSGSADRVDQGRLENRTAGRSP
jgi:hypothetical protein